MSLRQTGRATSGLYRHSICSVRYHCHDGKIRALELLPPPDAVQHNDKGPLCQAVPVASLLRAFFAGEYRFDADDFDWTRVTPFRRRVYSELARSQPGQRLSYGDLAALAGSPGAARAVGQAMRHNPFPPLVPCHRVVRGDGSLGGFNGPGGPALKQRLLEREES